MNSTRNKIEAIVKNSGFTLADRIDLHDPRGTVSLIPDKMNDEHAGFRPFINQEADHEIFIPGNQDGDGPEFVVDWLLAKNEAGVLTVLVGWTEDGRVSRVTTTLPFTVWHSAGPRRPMFMDDNQDEGEAKK